MLSKLFLAMVKASASMKRMALINIVSTTRLNIIINRNGPVRLFNLSLIVTYIDKGPFPLLAFYQSILLAFVVLAQLRFVI